MDRVRAVVAMLRERGYRITPQREAILGEVLGTDGHITPQDVARRVQRRLPAVNASTVYRTMALLEDVGVVQHAHLERGAEYHRAEDPRHVHLTCSRCGREVRGAPRRRTRAGRTPARAGTGRRAPG